MQVLIEIARRLDIHPADLVPELEPLLSHRRQALSEDLGGRDRRADALTVLTALATARAPLSADQLARGLGWQLPRTAAAIAAAQDNPDLGGPLALRRIPPETWTVTPRLDILTQAQRRALRDTTGAAVLDDDQARVLLAALAAGQKWQGGNYPGLRTRPGWAAAEAALKETGLIYSRSGPDEVHVGDDVRFSLRYSDDNHIARELGEPPLPAQAVIPPARAGGPGRRPASEQPGPGPACAPRPGRVPDRRAAAAGTEHRTQGRNTPEARSLPGRNRVRGQDQPPAGSPDLSLPRRCWHRRGGVSVAGAGGGSGGLIAEPELLTVQPGPRISALLTSCDAATDIVVTFPLTLS